MSTLKQAKASDQLFEGFRICFELRVDGGSGAPLGGPLAAAAPVPAPLGATSWLRP